MANAKTASEIRATFGASAAAGDAAGGAAASTGTGWGTIRGRFVFDGTAPTMPPYNVNKDQATCAPGGKAPPQEWLIVDSGTGGIKNVAVYLREASRVHDSAKPSSDNLLFDQKVCVFLTHVCAVTVGQSLDIKNSDNVGHNTNIAGKENTSTRRFRPARPIAYKVQKEKPRRAAGDLQHPPLDGRRTCCRGRTRTTRCQPRWVVRDRQSAGRRGARHSASGRKRGRSRRCAGRDDARSEGVGWTNKGRLTITLQPDEVKEIASHGAGVGIQGFAGQRSDSMMTQRLLTQLCWSLWACSLAALAGCVEAESEPPKFRLNMTQVAANQLVPEHQQAIADMLEAMFGTPDEPFRAGRRRGSICGS